MHRVARTLLGRIDFPFDQRFRIALLLVSVTWIVPWWVQGHTQALPLRISPWLVLEIVLVFPILEEIVFRGGLQTALMKRLPSRGRCRVVSWANLGTALAFAVLHGLLRRDPVALFVAIPALVFGWAREHYGGLAACTVLHVYYNAGLLWLLLG